MVMKTKYVSSQLAELMFAHNVTHVLVDMVLFWMHNYHPYCTHESLFWMQF